MFIQTDRRDLCRNGFKCKSICLFSQIFSISLHIAADNMDAQKELLQWYCTDKDPIVLFFVGVSITFWTLRSSIIMFFSRVKYACNPQLALRTMCKPSHIKDATTCFCFPNGLRENLNKSTWDFFLFSFFSVSLSYILLSWLDKKK